MSNLMDQPSSMADLHSELRDAIGSLRGTQKELAGVADAAGEIVAEAFDYAGSNEAECTARGNRIQQVILAIGADIDQAAIRLTAAFRLAREAAQAVEEADVRRKAQRAKLGS